jgi:hypothetical protein
MILKYYLHISTIVIRITTVLNEINKNNIQFEMNKSLLYVYLLFNKIILQLYDINVNPIILNNTPNK